MFHFIAFQLDFGCASQYSWKKKTVVAFSLVTSEFFGSKIFHLMCFVENGVRNHGSNPHWVMLKINGTECMYQIEFYGPIPNRTRIFVEVQIFVKLSLLWDLIQKFSFSLNVRFCPTLIFMQKGLNHVNWKIAYIIQGGNFLSGSRKLAELKIIILVSP